jgi:polyphosphate kinase
MHRNLDRRVEVLVRLGSPTHVQQLSDLIDMAFDPGMSTWHLDSQGGWQRVHLRDDGAPLRDIHAVLIAHQSRRVQPTP